MPARAQVVVERAARARGVPRVASTEIARRAGAMLRALQLTKEEVSIVLTDDDQIQKLNRVYRHKDRPTDVLAFAQREGELADLAGDLLGDVVVSVPTAARQANEKTRPLVDEITMLVAHGILHLLGWDHATDAEDRRMRRETDRLCAAATSRAKRPPAPAKKPSAPARKPQRRQARAR